ncbi:MAG: 2-amino-4-hydroxy-6-hydroxymethyldihydropteridine diphosphokinase [Actinomycetota bacterium]
MSGSKRVVIALGSNLGDRKSSIESAIDLLKEFIEIEKVSTLIETDPVGGPEQGPYLNGVLLGRTTLAPEELMTKLLEVEAELGRVRSVPNAPRTIDLDLIDYEGVVIDSPTLTLPHPRAHQRHFVIKPWLEIDPEALLVGHGRLREIMAANGL